ncbi:MAG TPA: hypothetical protein VFP50_19885, partial [Anaeromyxobacteraceae bacterium]|nr:hypothetical protein [Anaeromyxobacteraceae bacterium]
GARILARGPAAAALGTLGALELLLVVARLVPARGAGRRLELVDGLPVVRPTERAAGCDCRNVY